MDNNHNENHEPVADEQPSSDDQPINEFLRHQRKALEETGKALDALVPPGFKEHGSEAGREFIKGFKVLVDAAITELEKAAKEMEKRQPDDEGGDRPSSTGPSKVKVQVE
jgi:hypothetical protein